MDSEYERPWKLFSRSQWRLNELCLHLDMDSCLNATLALHIANVAAEVSSNTTLSDSIAGMYRAKPHQRLQFLILDSCCQYVPDGLNFMQEMSCWLRASLKAITGPA